MPINKAVYLKKADLHIHSTASDGSLRPEEAASEAARLNLDTIALTDHDTLDGIAKAAVVADREGIELIPGVELTADFNGRECHLLSYYFRPDDADFNRLINQNKKSRIHRARWIIRKLHKKGLKIDFDEVRAEAGGLNIGRPHIARLLWKKGYVSSVRSAFIRHLSDKALGPIESFYPGHQQVISRVKRAGGVVVLAHPGRLYSEVECEQFASAGIDGVEVVHPGHTPTMQKKMKAFAKKHHLLITGGSDYHGPKKDYYSHFGALTISEQLVQKLNTLACERKKVSA